jgi:hypothetical protein
MINFVFIQNYVKKRNNKFQTAIVGIVKPKTKAKKIKGISRRAGILTYTAGGVVKRFSQNGTS